jgi:hypothetical protein
MWPSHSFFPHPILEKIKRTLHHHNKKRKRKRTKTLNVHSKT